MDRLSKLRQHLTAPSAGLEPTHGAVVPHAVNGVEPVVLYDVNAADGIAVITFNRPKSLNAMTDEVQYLFMDSLALANEDPKVKVIVVTGTGRGFCAGAEMQALQSLQAKKSGSKSNSGSEKKEKKRNGSSISIQWWSPTSIAKPIIAAINGPCAGLGFVAAAMCDIRFTTSKAKFTSAFAKRGLVAEHGISYILPKIVGVSNALDILMSSRVFLGDEAKEMGFVSKVYPDQETLMRETMDYAKKMATLCSPASLAEMKTQVYRDLNKHDASDAGLYSQYLMSKSFFHPDFKEGVDSYVQKRDPKFQGTNYSRIVDL